MSKRRDITGQTFGYLKAISSRKVGKNMMWYCECLLNGIGCKRYREVALGQITSGNTKSCGCLVRNTITKHGKRYNRLYRVCQEINKRCGADYRENRNYANRGIKVCPEWDLVNPGCFKNFVDYIENVLGDRPTEQHSLDRIDNDKGYEPGNLRWATKQEQALNRRTTVWIEFKGIKLSIKGWTNLLKIKDVCFITNSFRKGKTIEDVAEKYDPTGSIIENYKKSLQVPMESLCTIE